jgi:hypothetical protein
LFFFFLVGALMPKPKTTNTRLGEYLHNSLVN